MKTLFHFCAPVLLLALVHTSYAQVSVPANFGTPANYVGWNAAQPFPLRVEHLGNQPIAFGTNNFFRMAVTNGPGSPVGGRVAFGNNLPPTFIPQDRLHSFHTAASDNMLRFSNVGFTAQQGFRVGLNTQNFALFDKLEPGIFRFDMVNLATPTLPRLVKFTIDNINQTNITTSYEPTYFNQTRVGIWKNGGAPNGVGTLAMLHMGVPGTQNSNGHRDWMNVGTYYNEGSDGMYVGIQQLGQNVTDAIIAWGDDGNDRFKIIFNTQLGAFPGNPSSSPGGLEVARFIAPTGNDGRVLFNIDPGAPGLDPQNTVHIVGQNTAGNFTVPGGNSGLRFQHLNALTPPVPNPGQGVLAVDPQGDVIYVLPSPTPGGPALGNPCIGAPNPLTTDYDIPLSGNNFYFSGDGPLTDKINFGPLCGTPLLPGKVNAFTSFPTNFIPGLPQSITNYAENSFAQPNAAAVGFYGTANNPAPNADAAGVWGVGSSSRNAYGVRGIGLHAFAGVSYGGHFLATEPNNQNNVGVRGEGSNCNNNIGVQGISHNGINATGGSFFAGGALVYNIGVSAIAQASTGNPPTLSYTGPYPQANIGLYATGEPINSITGVIGQDWAAWFDGDVFINGTAYYPGFVAISDRKFKTGVKSISAASEILMKLNPTEYQFVDGAQYGMKLPSGKQFGFISQEVEAVLPELVEDVKKPAMVDQEGNVKTAAVDYKGLNYMGFIALLTKTVQEQQGALDAQRDEIEDVKRELAELRAILSGNIAPILPAHQQVTLSDMRTVVLNQNAPNPFAEHTTISYEITVEFQKAEIVFTTQDGRTIRKVPITESGMGVLQVFAADLASGTYLYSLYIDGQLHETKRLIKQK